MDFVVSKGDLLKELQFVQGVVERRTTVPILSNLLLEATGTTLSVTATDLDVTLQCTSAASVKVAGALTVSARKLFDIARLLPEADIHFKSEGDSWVNVTCARSEFKIASLSRDNFPDIPEMEGQAFSLPGRALRHMINSCIFAITQEESRYTLNGALMVLKSSGITLVTTDGHRLVFISHGRDLEGIDEERRALVPRKTLAELGKMLSEDGEDIQFASSENHLFFKAGERWLVSRLLTGQFPNYEMVIPRENDKTVKLNVSEFGNALKRVSVMADEQSHAVRLAFKEGQVDIFSTATELGEARESMPAGYQGEPLEIGFNARYLVEFLGGLESEEVELDLRDAETQGLLRPSPAEGFVHHYVVMPMRL